MNYKMRLQIKIRMADLCQAVYCINFIVVALTMLTARVHAYITPINKIAYTTDMSNEQQVRDLSMIIESLENLGVLDKSHTKCYSLDKIVKQLDNPDTDSWRVSIDLHIQELGSSGADVNQKEISTGSVTSDSQQTTGCIGRSTHSTSTTIAPTLGPEQSKNNTDDQLGGVEGSGKHNETSEMDAQIVVEEEDSGLSLAQIMVISSCSTVIGLFFVAALTMRVRNYIKRKREMKSKRRSAHRTSSLGDKDSQGFSSGNSQDGHPMSRPTLTFNRPKPLRSHGYKLGSSTGGGFSLFYTHGDGGGGGWSNAFSY